MKILGRTFFERAQPAAAVISEDPFLPDVTPAQIASANAQIHKFAKFKEEVNRTLELANGMKRSYDAGITTDYNADFKGTYTSGNAEILASDYQVRARSRTIAKDTPQGKAVLRTHKHNVVGHDPFKLDMRYGKWEKKPGVNGEMQRKFTQDVELNEAIEEEWRIFGQPEYFTVKGNMSRMEADQIMEASTVRDGFILARHHRNFPNNEYGYAVELLECDRLQSQFYGIADQTKNPIRFSIEFDKMWNCPVAYWLLALHPGDSFGQSQMAGCSISGYPTMSLGGGQQQFRIRIDAKDMIMFNNLRDRAEQDIGFTELDSTIQALWRIFQYEKALTYAAIASCMKVFWYKKNFPTGLQMSPDDLDSFVQRQKSESGGGGALPAEGKGSANPVQRQQGLQARKSADMPGATLELNYGLELMQTDPKFPIEAAHEFRQDNLRDIAVGSGVRYQDVSGDFQNLGFAAALMCSTPAQDNFKVRQRNFIDCGARPIFRQWLRCSIMSGVFEKKYPGIDISITLLEQYVQKAHFKGKRWAFVNPLVQAQTLIIMLEAGIMSPQQVQDQLEDGVNVEDLYTMIEEANDEQEKHGVYFGDADVTRPTISKGEPGQTVERPEDQTGTPPATPTTKPGNPVRSRRSKTRISPETMKLLDQQGDGLAHNGNGKH